jgi:hypothetical protein
MKFGVCRILKPEEIDPTSLRVRKTPRGDAVMTGHLKGAEAETTIAIHFSGAVPVERAREVCNSFSGEFFEEEVARFSVDAPTTEDISAEEFDALFSIKTEGTDDKKPSELQTKFDLGVELAGPLYEVTIARAGETLAFGADGKPLSFSDEVLKAAVPLFNGVKVRVYRNGAFFDHLRNLSAKLASLFPEGMKDAEIGELQNARWDDEKRRVAADLAFNATVQAGALDKMLRKVSKAIGSLSKFLGLSMVVDVFGVDSDITSIVGCAGVDVVSVPAAGGHFERILNSTAFQEENPMKELLIKLLLALDSTLKGLEENDDAALFSMYTEMNNKKITELQTQVATLSTNTGKSDALATEIAALKDQMAQSVEAHKRQFLLMGANTRVENSALPESSKQRLFSALKNAEKLDDDSVTALINNEANYVESLKKDVGFSGLGVQGGFEAPDKLQKALEVTFGIQGATAEFGKVGIQEFYRELTGDIRLTQKIDKRRIAFATATTADFPYLLANVLNKRMLQAYVEAPWREEVLLSDVVSATDFKTLRIGNVGGFGNFSTILENGTYQEVSIPDDFIMDYTIAKYGGLFPITWECIVNDDVGLVRRLVDKFGTALRRTHAQYVYDLIKNGTTTTMWDGVYCFNTATHKNYNTTAYATAALTAIISDMWNQTEPGSLAKLGLAPKYLLINKGLWETVYKLNVQEYLDSSFTANPHKGLWGPNGENIIITPMISDTTDYYVIGNPAQCPTIEMAYFQGQRTPELLTQDSPTVGSVFTNDKYCYKVRHIYGGSIADWRNMYAMVVAGG